MVATPRTLGSISVAGVQWRSLADNISVAHGGGDYEEYHPYGTAAWRAESSTITVSAKRYRYTGMERDDETGLQLHGVRYYAPWLGRWCSSDPIGMGGGINRYRYASCSPVVRTDRTGTVDDLGQLGRDVDPITREDVKAGARFVGNAIAEGLSQVPRWFLAGIIQAPTLLHPPGHPVKRVNQAAAQVLTKPEVDQAIAARDAIMSGGEDLADAESAADVGTGLLKVGGGTVLAATLVPVPSPGKGGGMVGSEFVERTLREGLEDVAHESVERGGRETAERVLRNEPITTAVVRGIDNVPTIRGTPGDTEAADTLRHFAEGQGFSLTVNRETGEWIAIATSEGTESLLRNGRTLGAAPRAGTHPTGASLLTGLPVNEAIENPHLVGGSITMAADNTVTLGLNSGALNTGMAGARGSRGRVASIEVQNELVELLEGLGFSVAGR